MKNKITICLAFVALLLSTNVSAQAFQKGNINLDIGLGLGVYGTTSTFSTTINGLTITNTEKDGTASSVIPIGFEYGISNRFGIGADITFSNYFINDSDKVNIERVTTTDFGLKFNFHLLNADKNDLYVVLGLGGSKMKWTYAGSATNIIRSANGSGTYFSIGITDRIFFSDHIGIFFNLGYRGYNYSKIEAELTSEAETLLTTIGITDYEQSWKWQMKGVHLGTGLAIKF